MSGTKVSREHAGRVVFESAHPDIHWSSMSSAGQEFWKKVADSVLELVEYDGNKVKSSIPEVKVGQTVRYVGSDGNVYAAIVTGVGPLGEVGVVTFGAGSLHFHNHVPYTPAKEDRAMTWHPLEEA